jgi:uncharacterized protein
MLETPEKTNSYLPVADAITLDSAGRTVVNQWMNKQLSKIGAASNKRLQLILMPTERCNFRCTYCYEDFKAGRMRPETVSAVKRLLQERASDLETLTITWFGGEPLLAQDIILDVSRYAISLAAQNSRLEYQAGMTTNGYFLDYETAKVLAECGVRDYQISLDGPQEVHNQTRLRADGEGTYEQIWSNLIAIRNSSLPVKVLLRIHFLANTARLLDPLIEEVKKKLLDDSRFSVTFKAIGRWGGANDALIQIVSENDEERTIRSLTRTLFRENMSSPQNMSLLDDYVCYASRSNSLVIRSNGDIAKCTVALYDERNKVGTLNPDGTIQLFPGRLAPWLRGLETLEQATLSCPMGAMLAKDQAR